MPAPTSTHRGAGAARAGVAGAIVAAVAFFDGVFIGAPIALLAAAFGPSLVYILAAVVVVCPDRQRVGATNSKLRFLGKP